MSLPSDAHDLGLQEYRRVSAVAAATALLGAYVTDPSGSWRLPERLCELYTEGECEAFAMALRSLTGWSVVVVGDAGGIAGWVHAGVRAPSGKIFDAEGLHDPVDWLTAWAPWVDAYGIDLDGYDPALVDVLPHPALNEALG